MTQRRRSPRVLAKEAVVCADIIASKVDEARQIEQSEQWTRREKIQRCEGVLGAALGALTSNMAPAIGALDEQWSDDPQGLERALIFLTQAGLFPNLLWTARLDAHVRRQHGNAAGLDARLWQAITVQLVKEYGRFFKMPILKVEDEIDVGFGVTTGTVRAWKAGIASNPFGSRPLGLWYFATSPDPKLKPVQAVARDKATLGRLIQKSFHRAKIISG